MIGLAFGLEPTRRGVISSGSTLESFNFAFSRAEAYAQAPQGYPNPGEDEIDKEIERLAKLYDIPPIIIKAIAYQESDWKQFNAETPLKPVETNEKDRAFCKASDSVTLRRELGGRCGYGLMQITVDPDDPIVEQLQTDWKYNLKKGIEILLEKWKVNAEKFSGLDADPFILENWFYAVAWYNGDWPKSHQYVKCIYSYLRYALNTECKPLLPRFAYYLDGPIDIFSPEILPSFSETKVAPYTVAEILGAGGRIHKWDPVADEYIDISNAISAQTSLRPQPSLKAPWEGIYKISQGNNAWYSHNSCGKRQLDSNNCNWENTYAIDVALPIGTPVLAPAEGEISFAKNNISGSGGRELTIKVRGPTGVEYEIVFLHLSSIEISVGKICPGQVIAYSGASSNGSESDVSAHLHFHMWSGIRSRDSHTQPIDRLVLKSDDEVSFREYNSSRGDLDDAQVAGHSFESDNHKVETCKLSGFSTQASTTATALVMDVSGSMGQSWKGGIKLESAKNAAQQTINLIEQEITARGDEHQIAIATFSDIGRLLLSLTTNYQRARDTIISLGSQNSTNLGAGLQVAISELSSVREKSQRFIILLSDGMSNTGMSHDEILKGPVATARQMKICIHTVGFGDPWDIDEQFLQQIAQGSGCGEYLYAGSGFDLMNVYIKLRHISLGKKMGEFSSYGKEIILPGVTTTLGTIYIPDPKQELYFTLSWPEGNRLRAQLFDPSGTEVTDSYPGVDLKYFDQLVHIIIPEPQAGFWKVAVQGENVPLEGTQYYAILSTRPGGLALVFDLPPVCLKIRGMNDPLCVAAPGNLPGWAIAAISIVILALLIYIKLNKGGY